MDDLKFYLIRKGERFKAGGRGWSIKPKIWHTRAHALSSMASALANGYGADEKYEIPDDDVELVEFHVVGDALKIESCAEIFIRRNRLAALSKKFNEAFSELVNVIEENGEQEWQWVLSVGSYRDSDAGKRMVEYLKTQKLKRNVDYRTVSRGPYSSFAFKDKNQATMARLTFQGDATSADIKEYVEIEFDS